MADRSLFGRLSRLFSSDVIIRNIGGDELKIADTNQIQTTGRYQTNSLIDRFSRLYLYNHKNIYNPNLNYQTLRIQLYTDYEAMDTDPIIASALDIIADDSLKEDSKIKLISYLNNWLANHINEVLGDLIKLTKHKISNQYLRGLVFQLYENNGVIKRDQVSEYLKNLGQKERKILRDLGVKFGRYHIFLHRLIKPEPVSLRTLLWKNYHQKYFDLKPPTFGLNFLDDNKIKNKSFMLLCGFEKFDNFYVRIDILERLFMKIINSSAEKNKEIKMIPEMLNLLGCNKENFRILLKSMNYKVTDRESNIFFKYVPKKNLRKMNKKNLDESPFGILKYLNLS